MIIHQPEIISKDGYSILWARLEMAQRVERFPKYLWYRVPERYKSILNTQSDAFLAASLLTGMYYGEEIQVRGTISPKLAYHLDEYQFLLNFRMPEILQPVDIHYAYTNPIKEKPVSVGSTFSGGVDSLYTIWKHLPQNQSITEFQVTHGIFIRGFDILHSEQESYQKLFTQFNKHASNIGIDLIEMDTNMISLTHQKINQHYIFGPQIISAGLLLSGLFNRFYIPSSWDYTTLQHTTYTADPLADGFLSTDTMDIIHHGSMCRRVEKIEQIVDWDVAQDILWVCTENKFGENTWNCSRCIKCVRNMIPLYAMGSLDKFTKFEKPFHNNWEFLWYAKKLKNRKIYYKELFWYLRRKNSRLLLWLYSAFFLGIIQHLIYKYLPNFVKNWLQTYGHFIVRDNADDAYELPMINQILESQNK